MIKFACDTTIVGLISNEDEAAYRLEVNHLTKCCNNNDMVL